tara:strand:+ start:179146 stop:179532 length:387 start_codon:yes stop_codon:yes gene_type:complete
MKETKFKYPKRKIAFNVAIGSMWLLFGFLGVSDEAKSYEYVALFLGILYVGLALYMQIASYVTVTDAGIIKNNLIPIKISFSEIVEVKDMHGLVSIHEKEKKIKIHKRNIQKSQLPEFESFLETIKHD